MARITPKEPTASTPVHPPTKNSTRHYPHDTTNDNNNTANNNENNAPMANNTKDENNNTRPDNNNNDNAINNNNTTNNAHHNDNHENNTTNAENNNNDSENNTNTTNENNIQPDDPWGHQRTPLTDDDTSILRIYSQNLNGIFDRDGKGLDEAFHAVRTTGATIFTFQETHGDKLNLHNKSILRRSTRKIWRDQHLSLIHI